MSRQCDKCKIYVRGHNAHCPLCGKHIEGAVETDITAYPKPDIKYYQNIKLILIVNTALIMLSVISLIVDLLFHGGGWSFYVAPTCLLAYIMIVYPINRKIFYWKEIFLNISAAFAYILFIDYMSDKILTWSVTYIIPITAAVFAIVVCVVIAVYQKTPADSLLALLVVFLFSLGFFLAASLLFVHRVEDFTIIPAFTAFLVSGGLLAAMAVFRFRDFVKELFKKFRF